MKKNRKNEGKWNNHLTLIKARMVYFTSQKYELMYNNFFIGKGNMRDPERFIAVYLTLKNEKSQPKLTETDARDGEIQHFISLFEQDEIDEISITEGDPLLLVFCRSKDAGGKRESFTITQAKFETAWELLQSKDNQEQSLGTDPSLFSRVANRIKRTVQDNLKGPQN